MSLEVLLPREPRPITAVVFLKLLAGLRHCCKSRDLQWTL
jgi:hypothetical protein